MTILDAKSGSPGKARCFREAQPAIDKTGRRRPPWIIVGGRYACI
jgi:hypothetical protein